MAIVYIGYGIFSFFNPQLPLEKLVSLVIFVLGFNCFQDIIEEYFLMRNIEDSIDEIKQNSIKGRGENIVELTTRSKFEEASPLSERFKDASRICMFSHSNYAIFQPEYISYVIDGIEKGTRFQFIGFNPDDIEKVNNLKTYKMVQQMDDNPPRTSLLHYVDIKKKNHYSDDEIQFNVCDIDFPFGMTIVYKKSGEITVKVDLYTIKTRHIDRRCIFLSSNNLDHKELISFFIEQWNVAWEVSHKSSVELGENSFSESKDL